MTQSYEEYVKRCCEAGDIVIMKRETYESVYPKPVVVPGLGTPQLSESEVVAVIDGFQKDQPEDALLLDMVEVVQLESDPNGIHQNAPGAKLDAGKVDVGLLFESFPNALFGVAQVATFGANKYTRNGWKEVPKGIQRYAAAEGRHKLYRWMGESHDKDSKLPHQFHEVWNSLAQLELFLTQKGE